MLPSHKYGRRGIHGDREVIDESDSHVRKRLSDLSLFRTAATCGTVDANDCLQAIKNIATFKQYCPTGDLLFAPFAGDCVVSVQNNDKQFCTSESEKGVSVCISNTSSKVHGCEG
jgi:hypothetical protein